MFTIVSPGQVYSVACEIQADSMYRQMHNASLYKGKRLIAKKEYSSKGVRFYPDNLYANFAVVIGEIETKVDICWKEYIASFMRDERVSHAMRYEVYGKENATGSVQCVNDKIIWT